MKRFSKHELFKLRNNIDIKMLISTTLKVPSKTCEGQLRFLCPICLQFDTATMRETNLARCFRCERNFNTIEMVMETKSLDFVKSVRLLQSLPAENNCKEMTASKHSTSAQARRKPAAIDALIKNISIGRTNRSNENSDDNLATINQHDTMIEGLNDKINRLSKQLDQLKSFVTYQFIEKSKNQ